MISLKDVIEIHETLIDNFGGAHGVRDLQALESALARPFQTFDGKQLYETSVLKAASLLESILMNHHLLMVTKELVICCYGFSYLIIILTYMKPRMKSIILLFQLLPEKCNLKILQNGLRIMLQNQHNKIAYRSF